MSAVLGNWAKDQLFEENTQMSWANLWIKENMDKRKILFNKITLKRIEISENKPESTDIQRDPQKYFRIINERILKYGQMLMEIKEPVSKPSNEVAAKCFGILIEHEGNKLTKDDKLVLQNISQYYEKN